MNCVVQYLEDCLQLNWLWNQLVNLMQPCFLDEFWLAVASARYNDGIVESSLPVNFPYLICCLESVFIRHAAVHHY